MKIDTSFNVYTDANGGDPDSTSPTLRKYHMALWSKPLPNGTMLDLTDSKSGTYLYHQSNLGEFFLGSDAITHSYKNHKRKQWLIEQIPNEVNDLFDIGSTIGAYILFPNNRINKQHTINQARGVNSLIDDRFDLTLECIRLYYLGEESPLFPTLERYTNYFDLFSSFEGFINHFLLDDLIDDNNNIKFYLPFDGFKSRPGFTCVDDYISYKEGVIKFVESRNKKIQNISTQLGA